MDNPLRPRSTLTPDLASPPDSATSRPDRSRYPAPIPFLPTSVYHPRSLVGPQQTARSGSTVTPARLASDLDNADNGYFTETKTATVTSYYFPDEPDVLLTYDEMVEKMKAQLSVEADTPAEADARPKTFPIPREMRTASASSHCSVDSVEAAQLGWSRAMYASGEGESEAQKALAATAEQVSIASYTPAVNLYTLIMHKHQYEVS